MLHVNPNGSVEYDIKFLNRPRMESLDEVIERYESTNMRLFYHVIGAPTNRYEKRFGENRIPEDILHMSAEERFMNIIRDKRILGNPKSFFVNKCRAQVQPKNFDEIRSVSFTFASVGELPKHFEARESQFAICFFHDFLQDRGMRKVQYVNDSEPAEIQRTTFNSPYLIEICGMKYDMRWEKEWRIKGDLSFTVDDVAFLIVPDSEYKRLVDMILDDKDLWDYLFVIPGSTFTSPVEHLLQIQHSDSLGFNGQLPLFRDDYGDGLLMDADDFPEITPSDKEDLLAVADRCLKALAKSTIQNCYETRFTKRFLDFANKLDKSNWSMSCVPDIEKIKANFHEPWHSHKDLTIACYEYLANIQKARIVERWDRAWKSLEEQTSVEQGNAP